MSEVRDSADAIVEAWYPGVYGARGVARALLGHSNRWGKLPVTVYDERYITQVDMLDFEMSKPPGRTYRYFTGKPLWPFGYGLSYTTFKLRLLSGSTVTLLQGHGQAEVRVSVENNGARAGDEVVMAFFR